MAEQAMTDLKYGHFGQVLYNPEQKAWIYSRDLSAPQSLQPLGSSQVIFQPAHPDLVQDSDEKHSTRLRHQFASLLALQPTLAPAANLLAHPVTVSQEIEKTLSRYDPTLGQLLAFGRIQDHSTNRSMRIAVFPTPDHPHMLRFVQVQPQKHGWEHNKSIWIDVPRIHGESGSWEAPAPIRQICFAEPPEHSTITPLVAVRSSLGVSILRLAVRKQSSSWNSVDQAPSRFRPVQTCDLTMEMFGHITPADVVFNRWYPKQFATVDQQGTWRVWDTDARQAPLDRGKPVEICRGATNDSVVPKEETTAALLDDGWGKLTWAGNHQTLVTASRRCLAMYDIQGKPVRLNTPKLGIPGTPHWILDLQTNPIDPNLIFVLTSVTLFCLRLRCLHEHDPESYNTAGAEVIMQTRHFRDSEDISLSLASHVQDKDVILMVKSSIGPLATSYRLSLDETTSPPFLTVTDPTLVTLPEKPSSTSAPSSTGAFHLQSVEFGQSGRKASGPGNLYKDMAINFYLATVINNDLSIVQMLYHTSPTSLMDRETLPDILPPDWRGRLVHSKPRLLNGGFVEEYAEQKESLDDDQLRPAHATVKTKSNTARSNWHMVYELSHARTSGANSRTEDFSQILVKIREAREDYEASSEGHRLLSELRQQQILVPDIDQATTEFNALILPAQPSDESETPSQSTSLLTRIASPKILHLSNGHDMDPTSIYDDIISNWLTPLSQSIPGRVRLVKEQLARRIAAEICLASHVLRLPALTPTEEETQPEEETQGTQGSSFSQHFLPQSSLPTPSPTATPSLTTAGSLSSHPSTLASPEFARLQRYCSFAPEKSTPAPLPKLLANTLAHWSLNGNPDEYDWLAVQRQQERKAEEEDDDLTPKERARLKRRAEKHLAKQRRETEKMKLMDLASSQAPGILSASQPGLATPSRSGFAMLPPSAFKAASQGTPIFASSQSQIPGTTAASQAVSGRHGGKPVKKKKRVTGF